MPKTPGDTGRPDRCSNAESEKEQREASRLKWFSNFHLWDFITAKRARGKPEWFTDGRYPLQLFELYNRWSNPDELIGVRFKGGKEGTTSYALLDIDVGSVNHPKHDLDAFNNILNALEEIGLCRYIVICSSDSEGLHIYFPFAKAFNCYKVAVTFQLCLEKAQFEVKNGQLEIFPNVKMPRSLYKAHRLPLQAGSFVLGDGFNKVHNLIDRFIEAWKTAGQGQDLEIFETAIANAKISKSYLNGDPAEWKERLEKTLEYGWAGTSQTNQILQESCTYARVFMGLDWDEVECWVLQTVVNLNGYQNFCNHKRQIKKRVRDWVKTNRKSGKYYPYGKCLKNKEPKGADNEARKLTALERIERAITQIKTDGQDWPNTVRDRQQLICKTAQCSAATLYKYRELWHPDFEGALCVTVCPEGDSGTFEGSISTSSFEGHLTQNSQRSVTVDSQTDPAIFQLQLDFGSSPETLSNISVTGPCPLSVNSGEGQAHQHLFSGDDVKQSSEGCKARRQSSKADPRSQPIQKVKVLDPKKYLQPSIFDLPTGENSLSQNTKVQFQPNHIVKRKSDGLDGPRFRIKNIEKNGTVWMKWMDENVPLVGVCSSITDLELIDSVPEFDSAKF
jgi:hypothetical protein